MILSDDTLPLFPQYCFLTSPVGFVGNVHVFLYSLMKCGAELSSERPGS